MDRRSLYVTQREAAMREVDISLQKAGFFEERAIDIEAILEMYKRNGYNFYDLQVDLIKNTVIWRYIISIRSGMKIWWSG